MQTVKAFDCIRMKDDIQRRLQKTWRGASGEEVRLRVKRDLATSDSDVAKWWRSLERSPKKHPR